MSVLKLIWIKGIKPFFSFIFLTIIRFYQLFLSPFLGANCRYTPTCSQYGKEAIVKYGPFKGGLMALKRIVRCNPWGGHGHDPVP
ncbi:MULTISPECIES: membrane protein insertion efficiency factor YidD [Sphingobacterium]|uniref:membrane protein insertion efficiency factor YidD n=1 Tax=Sphingobacterium TaxID=28453 RepID=UPI002242E8C2|nr:MULTISPECIES: membrane protein insertion efficiency factor YidD [Sphingobacterium]MCW8312946.1 membrane protein insertion efficiency factor YidD [Sphingobacterium sp. InxBP1]